ncbi:MAG TPA: hypothetical protein VIV58_15895 [Kofleriaceae bacterium]
MTARVVRMVTESFHRDEEGRPLRESRTPAEFLKPGDIEHKKCPYHGSRQFHEKPMNVGALRQTSAHWDEITDALAVLRGGYVDARKLADGPELIDLWRISQLGSALPWWFILRDEPLPAYAAALSKATLGVGIWAQQMLMRTLVGAWTEPVFTAANIMESVEDSGTLIGAREVCAGSDKMLMKFFETYLDQTPGTGKLAESRDEVLRFGAHYANFKLVMWLYFLARRYLYFDAGGTTELLQRGAEPPDFFILEPQHPSAVPPEMRKLWFSDKLAGLVVPFAGDDSDAAFAAAALRIADAMGHKAAPATTFGQLDKIFLDVVRQTEAGLGGDPEVITSEVTDSLIASGTRAFFASL